MKRLFVLALVFLLCCAACAEELMANTGSGYERIAVVQSADGYALAGVETDPADPGLQFYRYAPETPGCMQFYTVQRGMGDAKPMADAYVRNIVQYVSELELSEIGEHEINGTPAYSVASRYAMITSGGMAYVQNVLLYVECPAENTCIVLNGINAGADESAFGDSEQMLETLLSAAEKIEIEQEAES